MCIFPSSLQVSSVEETQKRLQRNDLPEKRQRELLRIVRSLIQAPPDRGVSTDELMSVAGLAAREVRRALQDLECLGIATNDTALTAYVHRASQGCVGEEAGGSVRARDRFDLAYAGTGSRPRQERLLRA